MDELNNFLAYISSNIGSKSKDINGTKLITNGVVKFGLDRHVISSSKLPMPLIQDSYRKFGGEIIFNVETYTPNIADIILLKDSEDLGVVMHVYNNSIDIVHAIKQDTQFIIRKLNYSKQSKLFRQMFKPKWTNLFRDYNKLYPETIFELSNGRGADE